MVCSRWPLPIPLSDIVLCLCWRYELTRKAMYLKLNMEAHSGKRCRSGKAINRPITYSECVFVALGISMQTAWAVSYCHLWPVWLYHILPHYTRHDFLKEKKKVSEHKMCVLISSTSFILNISHSKKSSTRYYHRYTLVFK